MNIADGWDVIITAKPEASNVSYSILDETMRQSMGRLRIQSVSYTHLTLPTKA